MFQIRALIISDCNGEKMLNASNINHGYLRKMAAQFFFGTRCNNIFPPHRRLRVCDSKLIFVSVIYYVGEMASVALTSEEDEVAASASVVDDVTLD